MLAALAGFTGVARSAIGEGGLTHQQQLIQERQERRAALQAEREAARQALREERRAGLTKREEEKQQRKEREVGGGHVKVTSECTTVTVAFTKFPEGSRYIRETITIMRDHGKEAIKLPMHFSFSGSEATQVVNLPVFLGKYIVDVQAFWKGAHFDVGAIVNCGPTPQLSLEKLERLGGAGEYVKGPLTGHVGEVVDYAIIVRNTGNVPLTLSSLNDPKCDPGTITGGESPLAAGASTKYTCTHTLTEADLQAGSYTNVASITGTPPEGEGTTIEKESETVVVNLTSAPPEPPKPPPGPPTTTGSGNAVFTAGLGSGSGSGTGSSPKTGVLNFVQTTPPSLRGPQGCVRSALRATLRARGVATVVFYLDGHKLRKMTAHSARRGVFTITVNTSHLKVGAHRLKAKILMATAASAHKPAHASRSLTFVVCASAAVKPKFTG